MPRRPRLHLSGGLYHVILRGNDRQDIFFGAEDRARFYALLSEGIERYGYRVHAFCLMTNHVHLALQAGEAPLSAGMQNLAFRYTKHVNGRRQRVGHLFQGRFKAFLVDQDRYGLQLVRYLHLNPVRARIVSQATAYPYSSHRAYLGRERLGFLTTDWVLGQFGRHLAEARRRFARYICAGQAEGHRDVFYGGEADSRVVGEEDFVNGVLKRKPNAPHPPTMAAIVTQVCAGYALPEAALLAPGKARRPANARALVAWLALKTQANSLGALAQYFGRDITTVSHCSSLFLNYKRFLRVISRCQ